jgi:hypothetical protein
VARFKGQDLYINDNDQIYLGDNQEGALWYADEEIRLNHTISGTPATEGCHLIRKDQVDGYISTISGAFDEFTDLIDTPATYSGYEEKYVRIKQDGSGLEFAPAIVGTTSSGTTPPTDSNLWYNETYNMFFAYDPVRDKWLSISTHNYLFTFYANCDGLFLSIGEVKIASAYYPIPRTATITAIIASAESSDNPSKQFDIYNDTTVLGSFSLSNWEYQNMNANIDIPADGKLKVFCSDIGVRSRNPIVTLEIKWRYEEV